MNKLDIRLGARLEKAGLSEKEALVYSVLIQANGAYPSKLSELVGLNRSTTYKVLNNLAIKGLASELQKGKKLYYQPEDPKNLVKYAMMQTTVAEHSLEQAKKLEPELEGLFAITKNKPRVRFFEGISGVEAVFDDHVNVNKTYEMLGFSKTEDLRKRLSNKFFEGYIRRKAELMIGTRGILPDSEKDYSKQRYGLRYKKIWPIIRTIPREMFPYSGEVTIYGEDRVSIINFSDNYPAATIIEDKVIHGMMRMIFELAWVGAKKYN